MDDKKEEQVIETEEQEQESTVSLDDMNKSWNDSRAAVLELLGEDAPKPDEKPDEDLSKAGKEDKHDEKKEHKGKKDMEYKEEEDEEDEEETEKSLEDSMDEEAQQAMDVEPFLKDLVKGFDVKFDSVIKAIAELQKSVDQNGDLQKATAKMFATYGELQKAMADTVEKIGNEPVASGSVLSKAGGDRFGNVGGGKETPELNLTKDQILEKATKLRAAGKLGVRDVMKIEGRLNHDEDLPENIIRLLSEEVE